MRFIPRSPGRPQKVRYDLIELRWIQGKQFNPAYSKAQLARDLNISTRTARAVLNHTRKPKPTPPSSPATPSRGGLIVAW